MGVKRKEAVIIMAETLIKLWKPNLTPSLNASKTPLLWYTSENRVGNSKTLRINITTFDMNSRTGLCNI